MRKFCNPICKAVSTQFRFSKRPFQRRFQRRQFFWHRWHGTDTAGDQRPETIRQIQHFGKGPAGELSEDDRGGEGISGPHRIPDLDGNPGKRNGFITRDTQAALASSGDTNHAQLTEIIQQFFGKPNFVNRGKPEQFGQDFDFLQIQLDHRRSF